MASGKYDNIKKEVKVGGFNIVPYLMEIADFFENNGMNVKPFPKVQFKPITENKNSPFVKTAYYDPLNKTVTLYTENRSAKDVMRSYAHELVHHAQNLRGDLTEETVSKLSDPKYAGKDNSMMRLEGEAYLYGNLLFRLYEDQFK